MNQIKASNVWDEDYIPPTETDKLRGEKAKLYMELRDLDVQLDDLKYRQGRCRRIYSVCVIVAIGFAILSFVMLKMMLFMFDVPIFGIVGMLLGIGFVISLLVLVVMSVIFFSAMSVNSFWASCANILRIDKLEIRRLGCIREKSAIEHRLEELDRMISEEGKKNL